MTEDRYEAHFQINHLSHFLLTLELLPVMLDTAESCKDCRIVIVSSTAHKSGVFDTQNMNGEVSYSRLLFYCHSKLYNVKNSFSLIQNFSVGNACICTSKTPERE